jgi:uncharacterized protein YqcC (DUF446 family)
LTHVTDPYAEAATLTDALEAELRRLDRWSAQPLPASAFENMGAFGENTMAFEQWLQFVLVPRLRAIVRDREPFPDGSSLAAYGVRVFGADAQAETLHALLYALDQLVERANGGADAPESLVMPRAPSDTVALGDNHLPAVVYALVDVLPQFEGEALEAQLQTYDMFLKILSPAVRPELSGLLRKAAAAAPNPESRRRIERAADAVAGG